MPTKRDVVAVIDDNLGILGAMGRLLCALGYNTELYVSTEEFLDAAMTSEAICLIVDAQLGGRGIELARDLARLGYTTPIIFMSADLRDSVRMRAMEVGGIAFLDKPFCADALIEALASVPPRRAIL